VIRRGGPTGSFAPGWRAATPAVLSALLFTSCSEDRWRSPQPPVYAVEVAPILQRRCAGCHSGDSPQAGWSATSFLAAISCVSPSGAPATLPPGARAPILVALDVPPHVGLLAASERNVVAAWVAAVAPAFSGPVHTPDIIDPRSPGFHGALLRAARWTPMLDAQDPNACGRCHEGAPARPEGVSLPAPGAPACTSCHDQPEGVLACNTCHGSGAHVYPPRDPCFFPADAARAGAHAAHVQASVVRSSGLACSTCHPIPGPGVIEGRHGNGVADVTFDPAVVASGASYDAASGACAVSCHNRGGARSRPRWDETTPMGCNDCHRSPPAGHFPGPCTNCHQETNATGTALRPGPLHVNGRVDLGDGSGQCGACHGRGDDPWPSAGAHPAHESPSIAAAIACSTCHPVPSTVIDALHLDGVIHVSFSGLALARGSLPQWDGTSCSQVACHGANLPDPPAMPAWDDTLGGAAACGTCHGIPPTQHTASTSCDRATCHGSEIMQDPSGSPLITAGGKALHVDGVIEFGH
jgi:predicted CxxxxCH...CXXCH cytochrome family protein